MKYLLSACCILACAYVPVSFAIDETESLRQRSQSKPEFTSLSLSLSGRSGNSDSENVSLGAYHSRRVGKHFGYVMATRDYAKSNGVESADAAFLHLRYNKYFDKKNAVEVFVQSNLDDFRSLEARNLAGTAYRHEISKSQAAGVGIFREWEEYLVADDKQTFNQTRINLYWVLAKDLNEHASIANTLYYQPNIENTEDWRAFNQLSLRSKITDNLHMSFSLVWEYDSRPVLDVKSRDTSYQAGFEFEF